jgi:hypothetical protein
MLQLVPLQIIWLIVTTTQQMRSGQNLVSDSHCSLHDAGVNSRCDGEEVLRTSHT